MAFSAAVFQSVTTSANAGDPKSTVQTKRQMMAFVLIRLFSAPLDGWWSHLLRVYQSICASQPHREFGDITLEEPGCDWVNVRPVDSR
jgi:hypothetical protein